jgi:hypothetical protein
MNYTKPEVVSLGRAVDAVQSHAKGGASLETAMTTTNSAYEADE